MNILIVTQYYYPERFRINDIAQGLLEQGHRVTVLTGMPNYPEGKLFPGYSFIKGPYFETHQNVEIIRVPLITRGHKKGWRLALNYLSFMIMSCLLGPFLCRGKYHRIFVYQLSPVTAAFPAIILKWVKRAPLYLWVTDLWPETLQAVGGYQNSLYAQVLGGTG